MGTGENDTQRRGARTILAVDDSRSTLHALGHRLGQRGYRVLLAGSGGEALELLAGGGIDLVVLDWMMPGLSGLDVLREVRGGRDTADLPVILVTARHDPDGAVEALRHGADDYLARPYAFDVLAARIARTLARADRLDALKRANRALDARIAARAIELGEARSELAHVRADRNRLTMSLHTLHAEVERLQVMA